MSVHASSTSYIVVDAPSSKSVCCGHFRTVMLVTINGIMFPEDKSLPKLISEATYPNKQIYHDKVYFYVM